MKAIKILWILSLFLFLGASLAIYGDMAETVRLPFNGQDWTATRQGVFYLSLACLGVGNAILLLFAHAFPYMPKAWLFVPKKTYWINADRTRRNQFNDRAKEWVRGFALLLNLFLVLPLLAIYAINSNEYYPVLAILYVLAGATVAWAVAFFPIFSTVEE